jgi:uncharacterized protein YbjT (DUF2867 family)
MDNLLNCAQTIVRDNRFSLPLGSGKAGVVDIRDVAEVVLAALTQPGHENKTWVVTGPEILSFGEIAGIFSEVLGRPIAYVDIPPEVFREQLLKWGQSEWYVDAALQLFELNRQNKNARITGDFEAVTGRAPRSMRQFVQDHLVLGCPATRLVSQAQAQAACTTALQSASSRSIASSMTS